jgi:hypothetical protein
VLNLQGWQNLLVPAGQQPSCSENFYIQENSSLLASTAAEVLPVQKFAGIIFQKLPSCLKCSENVSVHRKIRI